MFLLRSPPGGEQEAATATAAPVSQAEHDGDRRGSPAHHGLPGVGRIPPQVGRRARTLAADPAQVVRWLLLIAPTFNDLITFFPLSNQNKVQSSSVTVGRALTS